MSEEIKLGLKIMLQFSLLIAGLAAFNLYNYLKGGRALFLVATIVCFAFLAGWVLFYMIYVKGKR